MSSITLDLQNIDLGPVTAARDAISGALAGEDVQRLLSGDAFEIALGGLGSAVGGLRASVSVDAGALLQPIVDAAGSLAGQIDLSALPIGDYADAVEEGIGMILRLVAAVQDPAKLGQVVSFDEVVDAASSMTSGFSTMGGDIAKLGGLLERLEGGFGIDIDALSTFAVDALLPFGGRGLIDIRGRIDAILNGSVAISLPAGRMAGLVLALDAVASAAANPQQLARALADLQRIRAATISVLRDDLRQIRDAFLSLHIAETLDAIIAAAGAIRAGETGFLEMMESWRTKIAGVRATVDDFDPSTIHALVDQLLDLLEEQARLHIEKPVDAALEQAETFVRGVFAELPHRKVRAEIAKFLAGVATTIRELRLDVVATEANALLDDIEAALDPDALLGDVQAVLGQVRALADTVLNGVTDALQTVVATIQSVEATLKGVLERVVSVLEVFTKAMNDITVAIETLGIEEATDQVVGSIRELRATAEKLFGAVPLPEPMRPMVEQVISTLESIDLDVVFRPVEAAAGQMKIPAEVKEQITVALQQVAEKLENAIPAALIESIRAEVEGVLETVRGFNPAGLLDGVTAYVEEAAKFLDDLDPVAAAQQIRAPFQAALDAIDAAHPRVLLAPVIEAYDRLIGSVQAPDISDLLTRLTGAINTAGAAVTQQLVTPIGQITGTQPDVTAGAAGASGSAGAGSSGSGGSGGTGGAGGGTGGTVTPPPAIGADIKGGDIIRFLGFVPARLREQVQALPQSSLGPAIAAIDSLTGGLARDLRAVRARILDFDARIVAQLQGELRLVADAQMRTQLALSVGAPGVEVNVSMNAVATISPSALLLELNSFIQELRELSLGAANAAGGDAAAVLSRAATALESFRLSAILGSADDFLAALDPEPLALEVDALFASIIARIPELLNEAAAEIELALERFRMLLEELNPVVQARKFFRLLDILREELKVLDPRVLADELGAIHAAIRDSVAAYDPVVLAQNVKDILVNLAASLRALDPAALLGDVDLFGPIVAKIEAANPAAVLENVGAELATVGEQLRELDPRALLDAVETLVPRIVASFEVSIEAIKEELIALLESIRFASANASVSVSASASVSA
jgi:hypothetical protein